MTQLPLFRPAEAQPRPVDVGYIRKHVMALVRIAKAAQIMPWSQAETEKWARLIPELTRELPPEEGEPLREAFAAELQRLRQTGP